MVCSIRRLKIPLNFEGTKLKAFSLPNKPAKVHNIQMHTSNTDQYLKNNEVYSQTFRGFLPAQPAKQTAVLACMDARMDPYGILGLQDGDSHVIRNAGGVVTDDALRSLVISQRLLGTKEIIIIQHTNCGMMSFKSDNFAEEIAREIGMRPNYCFHAFSDLTTSVRESIKKIREDPFILHKNSVRGFIFDVITGRLQEVFLPKDSKTLALA
jgi:carbonic anhydrase